MVVVPLLVLSLTDLVTAASSHDQPAAVQGQSPPESICFPGQYLSKDGTCKPCIDGKGYTIQQNMKECMQCSVCPEDTYQNSSCTTTRDTVCLCKAGTFRRKDAPEFCQTCTQCSNKEMEASPCTPGSDRKCVANESNTNVTEDHKKQQAITYIIAGLAILLPCLIVYVLYLKKKIALCKVNYTAPLMASTVNVSEAAEVPQQNRLLCVCEHT